MLWPILKLKSIFFYENSYKMSIRSKQVLALEGLELIIDNYSEIGEDVKQDIHIKKWWNTVYFIPKYK